MFEYVYVLRQDLYNEWAWENGATNLICVSYDINKIIDKLNQYLNYEKLDDEERVIEDTELEIKTIVENAKEKLIKGENYVSVSIYENEDDYDNGKDNGVFVIEKMKVEQGE